MMAVEIFSSVVNYKYKTRICSFSSYVVFIFIALSLFTPFFIIFNSEGLWLKNKIHIEASDVSFLYKYLLFVESDIVTDPIVCSTFESYKENKISDDCIITKVQEIDTNNDERKDILKFEAQFYTGKAIKSVKLLLFFNFKLRQFLKTSIQSVAIFDHTLHQDIQKIYFIADLELKQKGILHNNHLYETYNHTIELTDLPLTEFISQNNNRKFSATITNTHVITQSGYSNEEVIIVQGQLRYGEYQIHYQPSIWEELKWAWIQYLSYFLVFAYLANYILTFLFSNRYLNSYIILPWKTK